MAKIYGISRFVNDNCSAIQRSVKTLPKTGTNIIKFTNDGKLISKVVIPGPGNSFSIRIENTVTNYKNQKPHRIIVQCKEDCGLWYSGRFFNLKNDWRIYENLNVWTAK